MKTIQLTQGKTTIVDDDTFHDLSKHKWCFNSGYAGRNKNGNRVLLHREIMLPEIGMEVDHINGDKLDNRRCNLRVCTKSGNMRNRLSYKCNKTGFKCVIKFRTKYRANITVNNKALYLGVFATPEEAYSAYVKAAKMHHGEFANV